MATLARDSACYAACDEHKRAAHPHGVIATGADPGAAVGSPPGANQPGGRWRSFVQAD